MSMSRANISRGLAVAVLSLAALLLIGSAYAFRRAWVVSHVTAALSQSGAANSASAVVRLVNNPKQVPPFALKDLAGNSISTADFAGKVVLLNFWATWCPPCNVEIPELIGLQNQYQGKLLVVGISEDDDPPEKVLQFARKKAINYPIVMATPELIDSFGGVSALPTTFVVDTQGHVVQKHTGLFSVEEYTRELHVLLNMPTDAKVERFEDVGQVFLSNAVNATELPGVDLSHLTPEQKKVVLHRLNAEPCTCGCGITLAECRISDSACPTSRDLAAKVVDEVVHGKSPASDPAAKPASVATP
jgi:cytochrome c biogenesis protein CcmG, thiol:disulfide interchange protein DsbE